ncbi:MAG: hypothetical protein ABI899_04790 [Actinomycetota bacterium]
MTSPQQAYSPSPRRGSSSNDYPTTLGEAGTSLFVVGFGQLSNKAVATIP